MNSRRTARRLALTVALVSARAVAQPSEARVGEVRVAGERDVCHTRMSQCDGVASAVLTVTTGAHPAVLRVRSVQFALAGAAGAWRALGPLRVQLENDAPVAGSHAVTAPPGATSRVGVLFPRRPLPVAGVAFRVTLEVNGRPVVVRAESLVSLEHPRR